MAYVTGDHRIGISARLSLWEIVHRWEGECPLGEKVASVAVLDRLRWLVEALADDQAQQARNSAFDTESRNIIHRKLIALADALCESDFDPVPFKQYTATCIDIDYACWQSDEPLPDFWFEVAQSTSVKPEKKRQNASRQSEVIALAKRLYEENPELTRPAHMIEHPAMKALLTNISVTDKTKRGWISKANKQPAPKGRQKKPQN